MRHGLPIAPVGRMLRCKTRIARRTDVIHALAVWIEGAAAAQVCADFGRSRLTAITDSSASGAVFRVQSARKRAFEKPILARTVASARAVSGH